MINASKARFTKRVATYTCRICARSTRPHGGDPTAISLQLCEECFELAGIENGISDGGDFAEFGSAIKQNMAELDRLGVDAAAVWPEMADMLKLNAAG